MMKHSFSIAAFGLLVSGAVAQLPTVGMTKLPNPGPVTWQSNNFPIAGPSGIRYQQWFRFSEWTRNVGRPVRVVGLELFGNTLGQLGATVDMEVEMANGPRFAPSTSSMNANMVSGSTVVAPRGLGPYVVAMSAPATAVLTLDFKLAGTEFVWDGTSGVVVDIKVWDNGRGGSPYLYDYEATFNAPGRLYRMYGLSPNPEAVDRPSFTQSGAGLAMQFTYEEGISVPYGTGCPGAGGFTPVATTSGGLPLPGSPGFHLVVTNTASSVPALLILGGNNTTWGPTPLPFALGSIGGSNCSLWTDVLWTTLTGTVGGGPGAGRASFNLRIPPVTRFTGKSIYSQWLIVDPGALNGLFSMSQGLRTIFG